MKYLLECVHRIRRAKLATTQWLRVFMLTLGERMLASATPTEGKLVARRNYHAGVRIYRRVR